MQNSKVDAADESIGLGSWMLFKRFAIFSQNHLDASRKISHALASSTGQSNLVQEKRNESTMVESVKEANTHLSNGYISLSVSDSY
jgi:hypothetical protein